MNLSQPLARPFRLTGPRLLRIGGVFSKDVIHYAKVPFLIALAGNLVNFLIFLNIRMFYPDQAASATEWAHALFFALFFVTTYCLGIVLSTDEEEFNTRAFLRCLPTNVYRILLDKVWAGFVLTAVYAVVYAVMGGLIGSEGWDFPRSLLEFYFKTVHNPTHYTFNFLEWCCSLFATSMAVGILFRTISMAAFLAVTIQIAVFALFSAYLFHLQDNFDNPCWKIAMWAWTGMMLQVYCVGYMMDEPIKWGKIGEDRIHRLIKWRRPQRTGTFDPPENHLLRPIFILFGSMAFALPIIIRIYGSTNDAFSPIVLLPLGGLFLGSAIWSSEERNSARSFLYTLPISRAAIFWPRMQRLFTCAFFYALLSFAGTFLAIYAHPTLFLGLEQLTWNPPDQKFLPTFKGALWFSLVCPTLIIFATVSIGAMMRLFQRLKMASVLMGLMVMFCWLWLATACLRNSEGDNPDFANFTGMVLYSAYMTAVGVGLTLAISAIAFCRTNLLEQTESRRTAIMFVLLAVLVVWGGFLMATSPVQLFRVFSL